MATPALLQQDFVHKQLEKLHDQLGEVERRGVTTAAGTALSPQVVTAVRQGITEALDNPETVDGVYYSRSPVVSVVQSALHDDLERKRTLGEVEQDDEHMGDPFTKADIGGWVGEITLSLIGRVLSGSHPFCDAPAEAAIAPGTRLIVLSDWGTGRSRAADVARWAGTHIDPARETHVIHLGDTYYSGTPREAQANLLAPWPVTPARAGEASSWALNGNHDMYSGGHGLFKTTLGDVRFRRQQANGDPTSWFHMRNEHWNVLGLDTAWHNHLIELRDGALHFSGELGHLHDSQAARVAACAADAGRRLLLLSHHQLFAAYDDRAVSGTPLADELARPLDGRKIDAWFWGHEHDCLAYGAHAGVTAARAVGHGAVPVYARDSPPGTPVDGRPDVVVPDHSDAPADSARAALAWEYRGYRVGEDGKHWSKHGFAVIDLEDAELSVSYYDDEGVLYMDERL